MNDQLKQAVLTRVFDDDKLDDDLKLLVLAACEGVSSLQAALDGSSGVDAVSDRRQAEDGKRDPTGAFLGSITVKGFRGIGRQATLKLQPGPGLTLVVGRNGSGKSSFAEALELLLTGNNQRWARRSAVWKEGWRNLHGGGETAIEADLLLEGDTRRATARRTWSTDAALDAGDAHLIRSGDSATALGQLGWDAPLVTYRPFLSYNELGSMLDEGPSRLYDAMALILGHQLGGDETSRSSTARGGRLRLSSRSRARHCAVVALGTGIPRTVRHS